MAFSLPFLSIGPTITVEPQVIRTRTCLLVRIVTLGSHNNQCEIDSRTKTVRVRRTRLWTLVRSRVVPFSEIANVTHEMRTLEVMPYSR